MPFHIVRKHNLPHITFPACVTRPSSLILTLGKKKKEMEIWRISRCHIMYIWTCMYLLALQHSVIYLLREKRTCHSGNTTTHVFAYLYKSFFCLHHHGITFVWRFTSMMVPLVMTPKLVYMVDVGFFFTPMMGRQNVAFSSGCVTCALLNRRPWKRQKMFQKQIW